MDSLLIIFIAAYIIFFMKSKLNEKDRELQNKISPPTSRDFWKYYEMFYPDKRTDDTLSEFLNSLIRNSITSMENDFFYKKLSMKKEYFEKENSSFPVVDISGYFHIQQQMDRNNQNFYKCYLEGYVYDVKNHTIILSPFPFLSVEDLRFVQYCFYSDHGSIDIQFSDKYNDKFIKGDYVKFICQISHFFPSDGSSPWYLKLYLSEVID